MRVITYRDHETALEIQQSPNDKFMISVDGEAGFIELTRQDFYNLILEMKLMARIEKD